MKTKKKLKLVNDSQVLDDLDFMDDPNYVKAKAKARSKKKKTRPGVSFQKQTKPQGFQWSTALWCLVCGAIVGGIVAAYIVWG